VWAKEGQYCDPTDSETFDVKAGDALSLYGTGTESGAPAVDKGYSLIY